MNMVDRLHAPGHRPGTLRRYPEDGRGLHQRQCRQHRHLSDADPDAPGGDCRPYGADYRT